MLRKIIELSIKNKLIVALGIIVLMVYGGFQLTKLPIDAVPDITNNQVQVITIAPSYGASDIERLVTFPIEQANSNIPGIVEMRSFSRFGLSLVTIVFNDQTDVYWARQQVSERLQSISSIIPRAIGTPELGPVTTGLGEIYQYVLRPALGYETKYGPTELRTFQDWIVRRQLLGVKGIADVSSFGGKLKQYQISVDPDKLRSFHLNIKNIFTALENNNQNTGGSYIEKGPTVLYIRSEGLIGNIEDIENIVVSNARDGSPVFIKNVAEVNIGHATRYGAMCYNATGEVAGGIVMMIKGENSGKVIENVKNRIEEIRKTLPKGVILEPFLDRTKMVNHAIGTVEQNLLEGALIVVFILVLFLGNFRAGLLVASVIPLSMLFAVIMMNTLGVSGNLMSLGALDFGLIIDGSVIIVEGVMHQLFIRNKKTAQLILQADEMDEEVKSSATKMMNSAVFGQIIILVVYLPIFTLQGIEGKMFRPMAQTVAFALLGAFILSLTYIPMMSSLFLSKKIAFKSNFSSRMISWLENRYARLLAKAIMVPKLIVSTALGIFIVAIAILLNLGGEFIPTLEEGDFAVETRALPGSNLTTTIKETQKASDILLKQFPEVEKVVTKAGSGEIPTDPMPMEAADIMVILKDKKEWTSASTFDELAEKMNEALKEVPGITFGFQYPVQMRFNELMTGAKQDVVCKIFGENLDTLAAYSEKLGRIISGVQGAEDIYVEKITGLPQLVIKYDRSKIAQYKVSISDINTIVNMAFAGQSSGLVFENEKRFDLVTRLHDINRKSIEDVRNLPVPTASGDQVPLSALADVSIMNSPNQIQREDAKRRIIVGFNVRGRDVESIVDEVRTKVEKTIRFPAGYYLTYGGSFENLNAAKKRLSIAVPVSLLLILLLLYMTFNSMKYGLLIYSAIPLSASGGIFALALRGMPFSISAGVGFIALFGVAVLNGIVLIAEFNRLKKDGIKDIREIILEGTKTRLRPVLMTATVASLGFIPMALSNGAGAEVQRPLATVVIGGLILATFLTLFILPILYMWLEKRSSIKKGGLAAAVIMCLISVNGRSQTAIGLNAAIDTALKNNLNVKNEKLKAEYLNKLIKTGVNISPMAVSGEYGQINSIYYDNRFSIAQSFNFPTVYTNQTRLLQSEWQSGVLNIALREAELKRNVALTYFEYLVLKQKQFLLLQLDSLYAGFQEKTELRYQKGESNITEKVTSEIQRGQIAMQLTNLNYDLDVILLQFNLLLNSGSRFIPENSESPILLQVPDTTIVKQHPFIRELQQQKIIANNRVKVERSKLLPDISFAYNNMTMKGTGADETYYTKSSRFQSAQVVLGIPLFFGAQKGRIASSRSLQRIAELNYNLELKSMQTELSKSMLKYYADQKNLYYYKTSALNNARILSESATRQFNNGEINYLGWVMLINQSVNIKNDYITTLRNYNEDIIKINYLSSK